MIENVLDRDVLSFEIEKSCIEEKKVIGSFQKNTATIELLNPENKYSNLKGVYINTYKGTFFVNDISPIQEDIKIKLSCYDLTHKFDIPYENDKFVFPMTLKEWKNAICNELDIEYDDSAFPNSDYQLSSEPYIKKDATYKDVIKLIAQASSCWAIIDYDDKLYFNWFKDDNLVEVEDWFDLTTEDNPSDPVNIVVLGRGVVEDNVIYPETEPENPKEIRIDSNDILDIDRKGMIVPIYNQVNGFKYIVFNMKTRGFLNAKVGDKIKYPDLYGDAKESYIMQHTLAFLGGDYTDERNYTSRFEAVELDETNTNYKYAESIEERIDKTEIKTNKLEGEITAVTQKTTEISDDLNNNYYSKTNVNEMIMNSANGVTNTFSEAGGNNIIRNSHLNYPSEEKITKKETGNPVKIEKAKQIDTLKLNGYTRQKTYSGKNKNINAENVKASSSSPTDSFTNLSEYDGYKNVVEVSSNINYMSLRTNEMSSDFSEAVANGGIDITTMFLIKKTDDNTTIKFYLGEITGGAIYNKLSHYKDVGNGWAWYYTTHTISTNPSNTAMRNHIATSNTDFATFYIAKIQTLISSEPTDFEPYVGGQPSPNPDYPQDIEVGRGKNLLNIGSVTFTRGINYNDLKIPAGTYTFSTKITSNDTDSDKSRVYFYSNGISAGFINLNRNTRSSATITLTSDVDQISLYASYDNAHSTNDVATYEDVQLEKGSKATSYLPYNTIESKSRGKNILENSSFTKSFDKWSPMGDAEITEKFEQKCLHIKSSLILTRTTMQDISKKVEPGKIYTVSCYVYVENFTAGTTNPYFAIYFDGRKLDGSWVGAYRVKGNASFSGYDYSNGFAKLTYTLRIPEDVDLTKSYGIYIYTRDVEANLYLYDLQMELGDVDTDYQEYQESSIQYNLGDNFLADKDYIENGVLNKNVAKVVLDGSETISYTGYGENKRFTIIPENYKEKIYYNGNELNTMCNRFYASYDNTIGKYVNTTTIPSIWCHSTGILILVPPSMNINSSAEMRQWLSTHNVEVYYKLKTPEQIPLETTGELKTFEPTTIISNSLDTEMEVEFTKNGSGYEFWDGDVDRGSNDKSSSFSSLLLQKGNLSQEQDVPNGNYSVSFFYQKLNTLANASVVINDKEYQLDSMDVKQFYTGEKDSETGEYIVQPIIVTSNHIKIEFKCDVNDGVEVWDLMCNKGTVKLAWSQNQNETTTETVNISKGITITSTNIEAIFKANANGIRILTLQGAVKTYFNDKGTCTDELIVKNKAEITGTLWQEVGKQTWLTRM